MFHIILLIIALFTGVQPNEACENKLLRDCVQPLLDQVGSDVTNILDLVEASPVRVHLGCNSNLKAKVYQCWNDVLDGCQSSGVMSAGEGFKAAMDYMCGEGMEVFNNSHVCLNTKKDSFTECFGMFLLNRDVRNRRLMCAKIDILENCMTERVTDCGNTAVTWTRGFHKVLTGYMHNISKCADIRRSGSCTLDNVDACFTNLNSALGVTMTSIYDIVAAPANKIEEMCKSETKTSVSQCWDDIKNKCDFEEDVKFEADGNTAAIEYICGKGKEGFTEHQTCLSKSKDQLKTCYDKFLRNMLKMPPIPVCRNLDIQESCMTDAVKDCGESAVSWTRGFRRYVTRYLDRGHTCSAISNAASMLTLICLLILSKIFLN